VVVLTTCGSPDTPRSDRRRCRRRVPGRIYAAQDPPLVW
jgi:hypothetical protein